MKRILILADLRRIVPVITDEVESDMLKRIHFNITIEKGMKVPNVVHFNWYNKASVDMEFSQMLSVLSVYKHMKPDAIFFHTNNELTGKYWTMLKKISKLHVIHRDPPMRQKSAIYGYETDDSDIDRLLLLKTYGGIYLDTDVMVIKPFDNLRRFPCTLGIEDQLLLCGGIIICSKDSEFLRMWLNSFYDDFHSTWAYNSGYVPSRLARRYPSLIHIEETSLNRPNCNELEKIWGSEIYDWRQNYAIHTWIRKYKGEKPNPDNIKTMNSTYGEIARLVYYGSPERIE